MKNSREYFVGQILNAIYSNPQLTDDRTLAHNTCLKYIDEAIKLADEVIKRLDKSEKD